MQFQWMEKVNLHNIFRFVASFSVVVVLVTFDPAAGRHTEWCSDMLVHE